MGVYKFIGGIMRLVIIFLLVSFFIITGCGNVEKGKLNKNGKVKIVFWHAMGGPLGKILDDMIKRFNETHPNIEVKGIHMGSYDTLQQKIIASLMAKTSPDIAQCYEALTLKLKNAGKLIELDNFIDNDKDFNKEDIIKVFLDNNMYDGKLYSVPFNKSVPVMYYNKDLFKKVGLDPDKPPQTWEELYEYSKKLTFDSNNDGKIDNWGQAMPTSAWIYECLVLQAGGKIYDPKTKQAFFDSKESYKALKYIIKTLQDVGYKTTGFDHQNDFIAQKVGIIMSSSVSKVFMEKNINFDYGIAPLPYDKKKAVILSGTNVVIFKSNPEKEKAAWEFVKWFISPEQTAYWAIHTNYLPVRYSAMEIDDMKKELKKPNGLSAPIGQLEYAYFEPRIPEWYTCRQMLEKALDKSLIEKKASKEYLKEVNAKINKELRGE